MSQQKYILYGADFSLYSGKVRAYLNYKNINYDEILATIRIYKKVIIPETGVKFMPVVKTPDGTFLQDTSVIIDTIEHLETTKSVIPPSPIQNLVSLLLEVYGDEWLLIPAMHYRWNRDNFPFIYEEFGNLISPYLPAFIKRRIGKKIGSRFKGLVPALGITEQSIPAIEDWYQNQFLRALNHHFELHDFLLGSCPSIADFGFMGPLYAHLYRDPESGKLMKSLAPEVARWVERMNQSQQIQGEFCSDDEIADTLLPIIQLMFRDQWPVLMETAQRLADWYHKSVQDKSQDVEIPRRLGTMTCSINGCSVERMVLPYSIWMMQRPLDCYQSLTGNNKLKVDEFLHNQGLFEAMQFQPSVRVTRKNNKFIISPETEHS